MLNVDCVPMPATPLVHRDPFALCRLRASVQIQGQNKQQPIPFPPSDPPLILQQVAAMFPRISATLGRTLVHSVRQGGSKLESAFGRNRLLATSEEASSSGSNGASSSGGPPKSLLDSAKMLNEKPGSVHQVYDASRRCPVRFKQCLTMAS